MPIYRYVALNDKNQKMRGEITAANDIDLEERLKEIGLDLIDLKELQQRRSNPFSKIKLNDMIVLCTHLEQLDKAGVPLLDALADARDATDSDKLKDIMSDVYESVKGGVVLSQALSQHPKVFNEVFVGLIAAGERTGHLSSSFAHLSQHMKWVSELRRKVKKALTYPIVLLVVLIGVITVLMLAVVPKLTDFLISQGFELPIHTRALIAVADFFGHYWYFVVSFPFLFTMMLVFLYRYHEGFAYKFDGMMLRLPILGKTVRKIDMARFTHFFSVMFRSGIDILDCLEGGRRVVGNRVLQSSVDMVKRAVSEGNSLTDALRMSNQFPNLVIRMFKVGEDSGNMDESLENITYFYDREVNDAVDGMVGLLQPVMTGIMGAMIFWIVASVFGPLYETFSQIEY